MTMRIVASTRALPFEERFDRLIHAVAQLPDRVTLDIWGNGAARGQLEQMISAYEIADRVSFTERPPERYDCILFPSPSNARDAPLQPAAPGEAILLDPDGAAASGDRCSVRTVGELVEVLRAPDDPPASLHLNDEALRGHRVAVVTSLPTHNRVPLFNRVSERLSAVDAEFRVVFLAENRADRERWMRTDRLAFDHEFTRSAISISRELGRRIPADLIRRLRRYEPSFVLSVGLSLPVAGRIAVHARLRGIPLGVWTGETGVTSLRRSRWQKLGRRRVARAARFGLAYGFASDEYLHALNPALPTVYGRNTTMVSSHAARPSNGTVKLLTVGRLDAGKAIDVLVTALALRPELNCTLTIVGEGAEYDRLSSQAASDSRIKLVGAVPSNEVLRHFERADAFLFPSWIDVFGLTVVEAMGSGLPTIVNGAAGAAGDLAGPANSVVVDGTDPIDWAAAIERLVHNRELRRRLGAAARETVKSRWTLEHSADAYVAALRLGALIARANA